MCSGRCVQVRVWVVKRGSLGMCVMSRVGYEVRNEEVRNKEKERNEGEMEGRND